MREVARYWQKDYDWRKVEARLNTLPAIHYEHRRARYSLHSCAFEEPECPTGDRYARMAGLDHRAVEDYPSVDGSNGLRREGRRLIRCGDPSLPGYGFSEKPATTGWDPVRIARAWVVLMKRLGYTRYVAQGGDWGNAVTEQMALLTPAELLGIHTNMPATVPDDIAEVLQFGRPAPSGLSADERHAYDQLDFFYKHGLGYAQEMSHRPQTLYGIEDSPIGLATWMLDHDAASEALIARVFDGQSEGLTRDDILENVTLYWLTNTAVSLARLYWESKLSFFAPKHVAIPVAIRVFPDEIYAAPKSWAERAYPKLIHYNRLPKGGHFAAWEQPDVFAQETRASFSSLR
jgi:pimeloyl-ACP methyl ester carboxylesterase